MKKFLTTIVLILVVIGFVNGQTIRYVTPSGAGSKNGTSWSNAYDKNLLQSAIHETGITEVWVAAGTYQPTTGTDRTISFNMKSDVAVYGGFSGTETLLSQRNSTTNVTILSGDIGTVGDKADNSYHVIYNNGISSTSVLDGFTIQGGNANDGTWVYPNYFGGGIFNLSSSPIVANCSIRDNWGYYGGGVYNVSSSSPTLTNCMISGNSAHYEGGGIYNFTSSPVMIDCVIENNSVLNYGSGIYNSSSSPILTNCLVVNNSGAYYGGGLANTSSSSPTLNNCTISGNSSRGIGGGVYNQGSSTPILNNTIIWGNTAATNGNQIYLEDGTITLSYSCYANGTNDVYNGGTFTPDANCLTTDPKFINPNNNFRIAEASPCADAGNNAYNSETTDIRGAGFERKLLKTNASTAGSIDLGAYEFKKGTDPETAELLRIYVKANASGSNDGTSWENAYTLLQDALTVAGRYYEIWVAAGTYYPTAGNDRTISFNMKSDVAVYGGFAGTETLLSQRNRTTNVTILSGDIGTVADNADNSYHVIFNNGIGSTSVLDGFTIQGGNANDGTWVYPNYFGGGILNLSSSPIVTNCSIVDNWGYHGGGVYNGSSSSPTLTNCTFSGNSAHYDGGGLGNSSSSPVLIDCVLENNSVLGYGGGIYNSSSSPILTNCLVINNSGAAYGGGMANTSASSPTLNNCTISGNSSRVLGGGISNQGSSNPIINNSIIWGNTATTSGNQFYIENGTTLLNYSCYANSTGDIINDGTFTPDSNCTAIDPNFVSVTNNDFRIPGNSPCKNSGNNTYNAIADDIRGQTRIQNTTIDMGAYEWTSGVDPDEVMTWTGTVSSNWNTPGNWNPGAVPLATSVVSIPVVTTQPIVNENPETPAVCKNIFIESGATLTVATGKALTVSETLTNNSAGGLVIQSDGSGTGSLIAKNYVGGIGSSATGQRWMTTGAWHIVSSPLSGQLVSDFLTTNANVATNGAARGMMDYSPAGNTWNSFFTNSTDGSLGAGKGFSMRVGSSDAAVTFTGSLQTGSQAAATIAGYWNCIGNPYTSAIGIAAGSTSLSKFLDINAANFKESYGAIYVWNKPDASNGFYGNYTVISNTAPEFSDVQQGQAFMVNAKVDVSSFTFTSSMQIHNPALGLKSAKEVWPTIKLLAEVGLQKSSTIIAFNSGMTKGLDVTYDAGLLKGGADLIVYTKLVEDNGIPFAIQALPTNEYSSLIIPVGIDFKTGGQVIFSADLLNLSPDCKVILEDKVTKTFTDLSENVYKVAIPPNSVLADRFQLHTADLISGLGDETLVRKLEVYPIRNVEIRIIGKVGQNAVATLYDVQGRVVLNKNLDEGNLNSLPTPNIKPGLYLLSVKDSGNSQLFKILVRE